MALRYKRISESEDSMRNVLDKGEYPFLIKSVEETRTKSGIYDMLVIEISVMDSTGREHTIKDWVVFMDEMAWKFRHLCSTCGLIDRYESDSIEAKDLEGKHGVVRLSIADYEKEGETRKVNRVADYVKAGAINAAPKNDASASFHDDQIPF